MKRGGVAGTEIFVEKLGRRQDNFDACNAPSVLHETSAGRSAIERDEKHTASDCRELRGDGNGTVLVVARQGEICAEE